MWSPHQLIAWYGGWPTWVKWVGAVFFLVILVLCTAVWLVTRSKDGSTDILVKKYNEEISERIKANEEKVSAIDRERKAIERADTEVMKQMEADDANRKALHRELDRAGDVADVDAFYERLREEARRRRRKTDD